MENAEVTLRDSLTEAFESAESASPEEAPSPSASRDEAGRFTPKTEAAPVASTNAPVSKQSPANAAPAQTDATPPRRVPSTWKKDYHEHFQKLDPTLADYILERESQYARGVSTYKEESDRYKPLNDALSPFMEDIQRFNLTPDKWIAQVGGVHQALVRGTPEQKIQTARNLLQSYGIPVQALMQGQPDPLMSHLTPLQEELRQVKGQLSSWQQQQEQRELSTYQQEVQAFAEKHEHYETVRETMAGLLQSGVATDLQSAYDKAIRLNDDVWRSEQLRLQNEKAEQQRQEQANKVGRARSQVVSTRSATPGNMSSGGKTDLRSTLSEAFDAHSAGRV